MWIFWKEQEFFLEGDPGAALIGWELVWNYAVLGIGSEWDTNVLLLISLVSALNINIIGKGQELVSLSPGGDEQEHVVFITLMAGFSERLNQILIFYSNGLVQAKEKGDKYKFIHS